MAHVKPPSSVNKTTRKSGLLWFLIVISVVFFGIKALRSGSSYALASGNYPVDTSSSDIALDRKNFEAEFKICNEAFSGLIFSPPSNEVVKYRIKFRTPGNAVLRCIADNGKETDYLIRDHSSLEVDISCYSKFRLRGDPGMAKVYLTWTYANSAVPVGKKAIGANQESDDDDDDS